MASQAESLQQLMAYFMVAGQDQAARFHGTAHAALRSPVQGAPLHPRPAGALPAGRGANGSSAAPGANGANGAHGTNGAYAGTGAKSTNGAAHGGYTRF
jgi:hypothetical protein